MRFERTKNASRTFAFGVVSRIITILGPFITRTIIIKQLGASYTGLSGLFTSVLSVLSISELGIGAAASFCLYKPIADDDKNTIRALLKLLKHLYTIIGAVILAIGIALIPILKYLIKSDVPPGLNIYLLYCIYLLDTAVSYLAFAYKEVLFKAYQRGDVTHAIRAVVEIIKYVLQILILLVFPNYYIFVIILLLSEVAYTICVGVLSKRHFRDLFPDGRVQNDVRKKFWGKVTFLSIHAIASKLINSADNIILSAFISLEAVTIYGNYSYISSSVLGIILIAYASINPVVGNTINTESVEKNVDIFNGLWLFSSWVGIWATTCMVCLFQPFISIWLGNDFLLPTLSMFCVSLYFHSNVTNQFLTSTYINSAGLWNKTLPREFIAAGINLALDILLAKRYGIIGIVFASFISSGVISLPYNMIVVYRYVLKEQPIIGIRKIIINFLLMYGVTALSWYLCSLTQIGGLGDFFLKFILCMIVPNLIMFFLFRRSKEFIFIIDRVSVLLKRKTSLHT